MLPYIGAHFPKSSGTMSIYRLINGLVDRGHGVTVVALEYDGEPKKDILFKGQVIHEKQKFSLLRTMRWGTSALMRRLSPGFLQRREERKLPPEVQAEFIRKRFERLGQAVNLIPECDANIASSYETALAVYLSGKGVPFYFMRNFEKYFAMNTPAPEFAEKDASISYTLPMVKLANSTWLKNEVEKHFPQEKVAAVIPNGIDTSVFYPRQDTKDPSKVRVISYSGRYFTWKGFADGAQAVKIVRRTYPDLEWKVFGDCSTPPDNDTAPYTPIGFVRHQKLAESYSACDIMLCPFWFESFPMYPLEGMACGLAVVTTPHGVEDYARDRENCLIVPPKSPEAMAEAVIELIEDQELRKKLGEEGIRTAQQFDWNETVDKLEKTLFSYVEKKP
jgi:glycosyltransferase involved in cell wall biosynthesis